MGAYHRQQMKKLFGHPDMGPVLASDVIAVSPGSIQAVAGHTVAGSWILPRETQIHSVTVMATGAFDAGTVTYAVTYDGAVAASGTLSGAGVRSEATFVPQARQYAAIASSGALLELVYAVTVDLGSEQVLRLATSVDYIGKQ